MTFVPPAVAQSARPAEWVTSRIDVFAKPWVSGMVGPDFQAYARIFHPLDDEPDTTRWADVARSQGRVMHAGAQWAQINPAPLELREGRSFPGEPRMGHLDVQALTALCATLTSHTETPAQCWFAVWDGWGWSIREGPLSCGPPILASRCHRWKWHPTGGSWTSPGPPSLFPDASTACSVAPSTRPPVSVNGLLRTGSIRSHPAFSGPRTAVGALPRWTRTSPDRRQPRARRGGDESAPV